MLWSRVILVLILSVISVRPELSLEEIEKELEQLSAIQQDTAETTKTEKSSTATESDTEQVKSGPPKELLDKTSEVSKDKIEDLEKSVSDTSAKKDETEQKTTEDADPVGPPAPKPVKPVPPEIPDRDGTAADPVGPPFPIKRPEKPRPPEIPDRDGTDSVVDPVGYPYRKPVHPGPPHREIPDRDADETKTSPLKRYLSRPRFEETPAYRRLMEAEADYHRPQMRKQGGDYDFNPPPRPPPRWKEAPVRRTMEGDYGFNPPPVPPPRWKEAPVRRTMGGDYGFNPPRPPPRWKEAPVRRTMDLRDAPYRRTMDLTRAERMAAAAGNWVQETTPVKVPAKIPAPPVPDVGTRTFNGVRQQMNDKDMDDLVRGKSGLTEAERRKKYLMDLLAEKLKRKVNEAQKRGIKVPDKIMDYLWNYESRRGFDAQSDKNRLSD